MFWPGSNVAWGGVREPNWPYTITGGVRPEDWQQFNQAIDDDQRVNVVLDWVRRPAAIRPSFMTLYFDIVDTAGHDIWPRRRAHDRRRRRCRWIDREAGRRALRRWVNPPISSS